MKEVYPIKDRDLINEIKKYLAVKSRRNYMLFSLGINVGLRISDLRMLKVKDITDEYIKIIEIKTNKTKNFLITPKIKKELKIYTAGMNEEEYLFLSRKGYKPISRQQVSNILKDVQMHFNLEMSINTHTLRKTFGYHFYKQYKDVVSLQKIYNHSDPKTTLRYIGIDQEDIDKKIKNFYL